MSIMSFKHFKIRVAMDNLFKTHKRNSIGSVSHNY